MKLREIWKAPGTWSRWVVIWLLAGAILRFAVAFPVHRYPPDSDCVGVGLCAFRVLRGETPVFYSGARLGSLPSHLTAPFFLLFGASRTTLALAPALVWCLFLLLGHLMYRELLGARLALLALPFVAVPTPGVAHWTYMPIGYAETLLLCAATLWLAARLVRLGEERRSFFALGFAAGLGWWNNLLTIGCTGPALVWLLWRRPRLLLRPAFALLAAAGFALGAFPWIAYNVRFPLYSLTSGFHVKPAGNLAAMLDNVAFVVKYRLRELIATTGTENGVDPANPLHRLLWGPALVLTAAAALYFLLRPWLGKGRPREQEIDRSYVLFLLVAAAYLVLNTISQAGALRGPTVRYVIPLYLLVPGFLAVGLDRIRVRSRALAAALAAVILAFNLAGTGLPWTERRQRWARQAEEDVRLVEFLQQREIDTVVGGYWTVHPFNFLTREEILAIPVEPGIDQMFLVSPGRLPARTPRWALVGVSSERLTKWVADAGLEGSQYQVGRFIVYIPRPELYAGESGQEFLDSMRMAYFHGVSRR